MNRLLIVAILMIGPPKLPPEEIDNFEEKDKKETKAYKKKTKALSQRINQLQKKLGPEFVVLENILEDIDLKSPDGREIASIIQSLNESCPE